MFLNSVVYQYLVAPEFPILIFFLRFPNLFAICIDTFKYNQQMVCWEARASRGVAPLRNKKGENLVWLSGKKGYKLRLTTKAYKLSYNCINYVINLVGRSFGLVWLWGKKGYKLRRTTKAYKLNYNCINYVINLVGRSFGRWLCRRLSSGCSRRVRRMSFGCGVRRAL
jgi:hypothetical protein